MQLHLRVQRLWFLLLIYFSFIVLISSYDCGNHIYGQTVNPHNLQKTPGGSSGGEGALIGGGGSLLGIGSDIGGSIRIPASFCGISGFKPTAGRLRWVSLLVSFMDDHCTVMTLWNTSLLCLHLLISLCCAQFTGYQSYLSRAKIRQVFIIIANIQYYMCHQKNLVTFFFMCL